MRHYPRATPRDYDEKPPAEPAGDDEPRNDLLAPRVGLTFPFTFAPTQHDKEKQP